MSEFYRDILVPNFNYWVYVILMMIGLYAMIAKRNLIKKLIGMSIFQTAIILFYISIGVKKDSTIPILDHDVVQVARAAAEGSVEEIRPCAIPLELAVHGVVLRVRQGVAGVGADDHHRVFIEQG